MDWWLGCPRGQGGCTGKHFIQRSLGSWHGAQNKGWHFPSFHHAVMGCREFFFTPGASLCLVGERQGVGDTTPPRSGARAYRDSESLPAIRGALNCWSLCPREIDCLGVTLLTFRVTSSMEIKPVEPHAHCSLHRDIFPSVLGSSGGQWQAEAWFKYLFLTPCLAAPVRIFFPCSLCLEK